ncbi:uncharacterized protein [Macrobrachium rosenbergii]|uniref:uncharacterized protein isoform X1 n=1 Tax=Macrobrachium rosenbergii TaxID=79674 RepID=UPI0034D39ECB
MNFMYYKGFTEEKSSSSHTVFKKKKDIRKNKSGYQHGLEGTFHHNHHHKNSFTRTHLSFSAPSPIVPGHGQGCTCEVCSSEFPLRTHLLLDMSYSRLSQDQNKSSSTSRFSFFSRKKPSGPSPAAAAAALALAQEQRLAAARAKLQAEAEEEMAAPSSQEPVTLGTLKQDSLMIPAGRMSRFFPAGHPIPTPAHQGRVRMLEAPEPNIQVIFHMMGPAVHVNPALSLPSLDMHGHQRECIVKAFKSAISGAGAGTGTLQGMVLLNLERGGEMGAVEFPFMIIWIIDKQKADVNTVISKVRQCSLEALDPNKTGFTCSHYFDSFEEVATLARPPLEKLSRKATTPTTGYIITVFRVFEGTDGVKFERNWLGWTGARALYKSMTNDVGLRRLTLHKSVPQNGMLHYVLMCDCSNFLNSIQHAVKAVPSLRMRLCGDIGLYRSICTF